jgi:sigma-B regulation protein RsbU (phosphoserine phosphatase)
MHDDPDLLLERINDLLLEDTDPSRYMTLWYGVMNPAEGTVRYAAAGHDEPVLVSAGTGSWKTLENTGVPLGMLPGMPYGPACDVVLEEGDLLVLTTDGLWEQMDEAGRPFGKDSLATCIAGLRDRGSREVVDGVMETILDYRKQAVQDDDYTILVIKRLKT